MMSNNDSYNWCAVPECDNNSVKAPDKLWIKVPTYMKNTWLKLAKGDPKSLAPKCTLYFCEDHFNLEKDIENYNQIKLTNTSNFHVLQKSIQPRMELRQKLLCRICLTNKKNLIPISEIWKKMNVSYRKMFRDCCSINVKPEDGFSQFVCNPCTIKLKKFYVFRQESKESQNKMYAMPKEELVIKVEVKEEYDDIPDSVELNVDMLKTEEYGDTSVNYIIAGTNELEVNNSFDTEENGDIKKENDGAKAIGDVNLNDSDSDFVVDEDGYNSNEGCPNQGKVEPPKEIITVKNNQTKCPYCEKNLNTHKKLLDHIELIHFGNKYYCEICNKHYNSRYRHNQKAHQNYTCKRCNITFDTSTQYNEHLLHVHGNIKYDCDCGQGFQYKKHYDRHRVEVHKDKNFQCHICTKAFSKQWKLQDHIRRHNKEFTHKCHMCKYKCITGRELKIHVRRHTATLSFRCDQCTKVYKNKNDLRQHIKTHYPELKRHACDVCGKLFHRSDHKNNHQKGCKKKAHRSPLDLDSASKLFS